MDLKDESRVQHKLSLGERFDDVSVLADDCSSGCDNRATIRFGGDADDILRNNHRTSGTRHGLLCVFGIHCDSPVVGLGVLMLRV